MNGDDSLDPHSKDTLSEQTPARQKIESIFEKMEMMSMRQTSPSGLDFNHLNEVQRDKLLGVIEKNEDHAFEYYKEKLKAKTEVQLKKIEAGNFTFKTNRISLIIALLALFTITIVILVTKDNYFVPWLTFLTGLIGGYGFAKTQSQGQKKDDVIE
jgi:hypothetical protein